MTPATTAASLEQRKYGLRTSGAIEFLSRSGPKKLLIAGEWVCGTLRFAVNDPATEVPFGRVKPSGLDREGSHHRMGDPVEVKTLCLGDLLK